MKTKILMTVSFVATMAVTVPAMADTSVLCSVRSNYKNAGVSADYKPGVDVKGKPVVSADVAPVPMAAPKSMTIPLTIDMAQRLNAVLPAGSKMESQVGTVDIMQNGTVMINGKDVTSSADAVCSTLEKQKAAALRTNDAPKAHKKKAAAPKKQSSSEVPPVEAAPAAEVKAEPVPPTPTAPQAAPAPTPAPAPEAAPVPQVLDATPPSMPPAAPTPAAPQPTPVTTPAAPAPAAPNAAPTPPASGAIVSPTEGNNVPRAPLDPLSGQPAPAAPTPAPANGTLSGGAQ